jgi:hypothetical protein
MGLSLLELLVRGEARRGEARRGTRYKTKDLLYERFTAGRN